MVGNLDPRGGHARLDNMDVSEWPAADRGQYIGYLPQDVELFAGTIRENIARMAEGDSDQVVEAANKAGVHEMILRMEKGYETQIGDGGAALSGGQRQRIALARAIYGNPCLLVLDEPNANLDSDGENALMQAIDTLAGEGMTVVVVAHRPNVLRFADKIVVLRNGMVDDFGYRDEILEKLQGPQKPALASPNAFTSRTVEPSLQLGQGELSPQPKRQMNNQPKTSDNRNDASARMSRMQAIKKRNIERAKERAEHKKKLHTRVEAGNEDAVTSEVLQPISREVKAEILSLAGRSLSEEEVSEIYKLYSSGDKENMLRKLKGVG